MGFEKHFSSFFAEALTSGVLTAEIIQPDPPWDWASLTCLKQHAECLCCGMRSAWPARIVILYDGQAPTVCMPIPICGDCVAPQTIRAGIARVHAEMFPNKECALQIKSPLTIIKGEDDHAS